MKKTKTDGLSLYLRMTSSFVYNPWKILDGLSKTQPKTITVESLREYEEAARKANL
jgi:hypothetical protein